MDGDVACAVADVVGLEGWLRSVSLERSASGGQRAQLHAASRTSECGRDGEGHPSGGHGVAVQLVLWPDFGVGCAGRKQRIRTLH